MFYQAAEYLNGESSDLFWSFVGDISDISDFSSRTDREKYDTVIQLASKSLTASQVDLLKFSLSLKTESPKVELFSHLASDRGVGDLHCPVVYEAGDKLSCHLPDLEVRRRKAGLKTYEIDHVFPSL